MKKIIALNVVVILGVMSSLSIFIINHYLNRINRVDAGFQMRNPSEEDFEKDPYNGQDIMDPRDVQWGEPDSLNDEHLLNILLVGQDRRPGEGRQRSDTMILISINQRKRKVAMISFLRDLYVQIPGYSNNRLNASYAFGGFELLKSTLKTNFGITIDNCFEVDFTGFRALIDAVDGIDITLTKEEADAVGLGTVEGQNHLNGKQALTYARLRKVGTDFGRTKRQRTVLLAAFQKIRKISFTDLLRLLEDTLPYLTTDMTNSEIYLLLLKLFPLVTSVKIDSYYIPPDGAYSNLYINEMDILYPNLPKIRELLKEEYMPF